MEGNPRRCYSPPNETLFHRHFKLQELSVQNVCNLCPQSGTLFCQFLHSCLAGSTGAWCTALSTDDVCRATVVVFTKLTFFRSSPEQGCRHCSQSRCRFHRMPLSQGAATDPERTDLNIIRPIPKCGRPKQIQTESEHWQHWYTDVSVVLYIYNTSVSLFHAPHFTSLKCPMLTLYGSNLRHVTLSVTGDIKFNPIFCNLVLLQHKNLRTIDIDNFETAFSPKEGTVSTV